MYICIWDMQSGNTVLTKEFSKWTNLSVLISNHVTFYLQIIGHGWMLISVKSTLYFNVVIGSEDVNR